MPEYPESPSNQSSDYEDDIDLRELIKVLWQGKFWIIGTTFIAAVISVAIALGMPNIYRAEALLATGEGGGAFGGGKMGVEPHDIEVGQSRDSVEHNRCIFWLSA